MNYPSGITAPCALYSTQNPRDHDLERAAIVWRQDIPPFHNLKDTIHEIYLRLQTDEFLELTQFSC
jgi:hypothetical protein